MPDPERAAEEPSSRKVRFERQCTLDQRYAADEVHKTNAASGERDGAVISEFDRGSGQRLQSRVAVEFALRP